VPQGSFFDADPEAAISCSPLVGAMVFPLLGVALSKVMYPTEQCALVCGSTSSSASAVMVAGTNQHGVRVTDFMGYPLNAYGLAARSDRDGIDVWGFPHGPWGKAPDVEDIESEFPLLHLYQKQQRDTCGFGKYRGGVGAAVGYVVYQTPQLAFTSSQKESKFPAHNGLFGGYSMTVIPGIRVRGADVLELMAGGESRLPTDDYMLASGESALQGEVIVEHQTRGIRVVDEGDILAASTQGSGGYGDVLDRDPQKVVNDLRADLISAWAAREVFAVAYDSETLMVDDKGTSELRQEHRARRLERARPYAEFIADWEQRRPPDEVLKYFGEWPSGAANRKVVRI
jgi:N-methylhydantoinase B/oxoprolinase/acetone carboxylase alpha subunit